MTATAAWRLLAQSPGLRVLLGAGFAASIGAYLQSTAEGWLVVGITGSAIAVGVLAFVGAIPLLLFAWPAGALTDRRQPLRVLRSTQALMALAGMGVALLVVSGLVTPGLIFFFAFAKGTAGTVGSPAYISLMPLLLPARGVGPALAFNSLLGNVSRVIGPAVAGLGIAAIGVGACFAAGAIFLVLGAIVLIGMPRPPALDADRDRGAGDVGRTLMRLIRAPTVSGLLYLSGVLALLVGPSVTLLPVYVQQLGAGPATLGLLTAAFGAGAAIGSGAMAVAGGAATRRSLAAAAIVTAPIATIAAGVVPGIAAAVLALALVGAGLAVFSIQAVTVVTLSARPSERGRSLSVYLIFAQGLAPLGSLLAGAIAELLGARPAYTAMGTMALALVVGFEATRSARRLVRTGTDRA